jgi:predicted nucleotidyltransferase
MRHSIDLEPEYLNLVISTLSHHLPPKARVWLFGSRACGKAKKFSDIDLLVDAGQPLSLALLAELSNAFEESSLPYKVDIADATSISNAFAEHIASQLIPLPIE